MKNTRAENPHLFRTVFGSEWPDIARRRAGENVGIQVDAIAHGNAHMQQLLHRHGRSRGSAAPTRNDAVSFTLRK